MLNLACRQYAKDYLQNICEKLMKSGAMSAWPAHENIERSVHFILHDAPDSQVNQVRGQLQTAGSGPHGRVTGKQNGGTRTWAQKGSASGLNQGPPGLAPQPHIRPPVPQKMMHGGRDSWLRREPFPPAPPPQRLPALHKAANSYEVQLSVRYHISNVQNSLFRYSAYCPVICFFCCTQHHWIHKSFSGSRFTTADPSDAIPEYETHKLDHREPIKLSSGIAGSALVIMIKLDPH